MCHIKVIQSDYMSITIMWVLKWIFANNMAEKCVPTVPIRDDRHLRCSVPCRSSVCKGLNLAKKTVRVKLINLLLTHWITEVATGKPGNGHWASHIFCLLLIWHKCQIFVACSFSMHFSRGVGRLLFSSGRPLWFCLGIRDVYWETGDLWCYRQACREVGWKYLKIMKKPNRNKNNIYTFTHDINSILFLTAKPSNSEILTKKSKVLVERTSLMLQSSSFVTIDVRYAGRLRPGEVKLLYPWRCFMDCWGWRLEKWLDLTCLGGCTVACEA